MQCDDILFEVVFLFVLAVMVASGRQFSRSLGLRGKRKLFKMVKMELQYYIKL